jgi:hypothetical protein
MIPRLLILASAIIIFSLGALHLWLTFVGDKLKPRDPELEARLKNVSPVITSGAFLIFSTLFFEW